MHISILYLQDVGFEIILSIMVAELTSAQNGSKMTQKLSVIYLSMYVSIYISIPEFRAPLYRPCQEVTVYLETYIYIYAFTRNQLL